MTDQPKTTVQAPKALGERRYRAIYGDLDPFAIAPFLVRYGEPLSAEGHRLAWLLDRAIFERPRTPITMDIQIELARLLVAPFDERTRRYDMALHRQKLVALLERYRREIGRNRLKTPFGRF